MTGQKELKALKEFMRRDGLFLEHNGKKLGLVSDVLFEGDNAVLTTAGGEVTIEMDSIAKLKFFGEESVQIQTMGYELRRI